MQKLVIGYHLSYSVLVKAKNFSAHSRKVYDQSQILSIDTTEIQKSVLEMYTLGIRTGKPLRIYAETKQILYASQGKIQGLPRKLILGNSLTSALRHRKRPFFLCWLNYFEDRDTGLI